MRSDDTIAAIASAPGAAEVGLIRISGPDAVTIYRRLVDDDAEPNNAAQARKSYYHTAAVNLARFGGRGQLPINAYVWPHTRSYTGQPSVELRTLGSAPLLEMLLEELFRAGARPAQRGEFTLRAFLAGRMDLAQADAVLGVIEAADFQQLNVALKQLAGGLSGLITAARSELLNVLADLEAGLDFVDEDIEFIAASELIARLSSVRDEMQTLHQQAEQRMQSQHRARVVLGGLPNAGKSTLFNALAGCNAALVSEVSGTTRDYLAAAFQWEGTDLELVDTAGWMPSTQAIEQAAQAQRAEQFEQATLVLWCDASQLSAEEQELNDAYRENLLSTQQRPERVLVVRTKSDLVVDAASSMDFQSVHSTKPRIQHGLEAHATTVSAATGSGLAELKSAILSRLNVVDGAASELIGSTAARSRESLRAAVAALDHAIGAAQAELGDELVAIEIREALEQLGQIVGAVYTDDLLDRIFSRFCIGK